MLNDSKTLLLLKIFLTLEVSNALNLCQAPNFGPGDCKPIQECPPLHHNYQNEFTSSPQVSNYIKRSECGFVDGKPKVCCPIRKDNLKKISEKTFINSSLLPSLDSCGRSSENKIFGGEATNLDEFPWMVLLDYEDEFGSSGFRCGGALINDRYVLTAAHCINSDLVRVRLGEYNIESTIDCLGNVCMPPPLDIPIEEKIVFKSYDSHKNVDYHDIALLRLKEKVEYSDYIKPICLPIGSHEIFKTHLEEKLTVAGWGMTETSPSSNKKLKVKVPVSSCQKLPSLYLDAGQVCAGGEEGKDSCKGDSGGPLMSLQFDEEHNARWYAIGVLSFGDFPCARRGLPGVYTKVSKYVYWIVDNLRP